MDFCLSLSGIYVNIPAAIIQTLFLQATAFFLDVKGAFHRIEHSAIMNSFSEIGIKGHLFD